MKKDVIDEAYEKAIECLKICSTSNGLYASGGKNGYRGVWARDSMISLIGASFSNEKFVKEQFEKSLITLGKNQTENGQIPNAVFGFGKGIKADYLSIDSSLWFVIGHYVYKKKYGSILFNKYKKEIKKAVTWISFQDIGKDAMLEQLPTTDWQDAFPHRYGRTINTQALYFKMLGLVGDKKKLVKLKKDVNENNDVKLWNNEFYYSYRWKNHGKYKEIGDWFDSLGNLLAIVFELADKNQAEKIISHIKNEKINLPYPVKSIFPPIKKGGKYWEDYYMDCDARKPYHYLNAGIWPYIGSFYVLALIKLRRFKEAEKELEKLAEANLKGNFPEWINPVNKKNNGKLQAWDAGTYILAYESLKRKKCLI